MSSMIGERLKISIFGQSHGVAVGIVMDGLPAGEEVDLEQLQAFMNRRAPGKTPLATARREADAPRVLSGLVDGLTCGVPLCAVIENADARSGDYAAPKRLPRPSHADYPAQVRHAGHQDARGGGHFSGRLTAPLCVAGGIALQILARRGVFIGSHLEAVGSAKDRRFDPVGVDRETLALPVSRSIPVLDEAAVAAMEAEIMAATGDGDSVGGVIECAAIGLRPGLGDPMFGGVENRLAAALFGIPGIRGVEFGSGFAAAAMRGSEHNDPYRVQGGAVVTQTNHHGGVLGGMTTGMPLILRVAVKPTPSIAREQHTVDLEDMTETTLSVQGRHDPCIAPRAVPCVEAAVALVILDIILSTPTL